MKTNSQKKGFTLIELLVVIAIVAILAVVVVLTLNPAELLKQARDSNRISDLNTVKSALSVYLADVASPVLGVAGACYLSASTTNSLANCGFQGTYATVVSSTNRGVSGSGWIPVNLSAMSSGAPFGQLPVDPTAGNVYVYRYVASTTSNTFKMMATLESAKYLAAGNAAATDGGASSTAYEAGTNMSL
jgi:prepilin-type N-terminal cleavage/methylation domain-containing protein